MKTKILSSLTVAAALLMSSCADTFEPAATTATGEVALKSIGVEVSHNETVVSRAEVDLNPFIVTIYNESDAVVSQWRFADMPEIFSLPVGSYTVDVKSHEVAKAEWDAPLYQGKKTFKINKDKITEIGTVTCSFASLKVSVRFGDDLRKVMGDDVKVRVVANDEGELVFTPSETRSGYFEVVEGSTTLAAYFTGTVNGVVEDITSTYTEVKAGTHYILNYTLRTNPLEPDPETGMIDPSQGIYVLPGVEEETKDGSVNNDEEIIPGLGDHNQEEFVEQVDMKYDASAQQITIAAPAGLASVTVAVADDENPEFSAAFSALNGANLAVSDMTRFGLPAPSQVNGAAALTISLDRLIADAKEFEGSHVFTFEAADKDGSKSDAVSVSVRGAGANEPISFSVPNPESNAFQLDTPLQMTYGDAEGKINGSTAYEAMVYITAPAHIKSLILKVASTSDDFANTLDEIGILKGADLAKPGDKKSTFDDLNLPTEEAVTDTDMVEFDIQTFVPLLTNFIGSHTFSIEVTDNNNETRSTSIIFNVK